MKFKVTIDLDIWNEEFLNMINEEREWNDLPLYENVDDIPEHEIEEFLESTTYIQDDIEQFGYDINKIELISKEEAS